MPPRYEEFRRHFPVGTWQAGATIDLASYDGSAGTTAYSPGDANGTNRLLRDPVYGYVASGIRYPFFYFSVPNVQEDTQNLSGLLESNIVGGPIYHVVGPWGRTGAPGSGTGIQDEYYAQDPSFWTEANADALVAPIVANYQDHAGLLAYNLEDDVTGGSTTHRAAVVEIAKSFQRHDPYGRPAVFVHLFPNQENLWAAYDCKIACTYIYPCGYYADGVTETAEGDFMSARVNASAPLVSGASQRDWVDYLRWWFSFVPTGVPVWLFLQTHDTAGTGTNGIRTPTDREFRKQFWIAVGEGVKGIFWFPGDNSTDIVTKGLFDTTRRSSMVVASELSQRLSPEIRKVLLKCERVTDLFTTSGGGKTYATPTSHNYPSAYKSTLQHKDGRYFVTICNHDTAAATVTINSATLTGRLRNMETNTYIRVGGTWDLSPLDGTIFEFVPDAGVQHKEPNYGFFTVENWWGVDDGGHWAHPDSSNFVPYGAQATYPREVVVAPGNLQAAVEANGRFTTFRLAPGTHPRISYVFPGEHAFIPDDPQNPPTCHGFDIYGSTYALQYNNGGTIGLPHHLKVLKTPAALAAWNNPPRGLMIRGLNFVSNGDLVNWEWFKFANGFWNHDHFWSNAGLGMRLLEDWLVESCTFTGYVAGHLLETRQPNTFTDPPPLGFDTSGTNLSHPGNIWVSAGCTSGTIRDTTFNGPTSGNGFPYPVYLDGARGCVLEGITLTGKWRGQMLFLTNDDFSFDLDYNGITEKGVDMRDAWCNVCANWTVDQAGQTPVNAGYDYAGGNALFKNIVINNVTSNMGYIVTATTKPYQQFFRGLYYMGYGVVLDGMEINGTGPAGCTSFLYINSNAGLGDPQFDLVEPKSTNPFRSRTGFHTIKNCSSPAVGAWEGFTANFVLPDGTTTQSNNTIG